MNQVDERIRAALDEAVGSAPPPVAVDEILARSRLVSVGERQGSMDLKFRRWMLLPVVLVAVVGFAVVALLDSDDSTPAPSVEVETVDQPPPAPGNTESVPDLLFTASRSGWLSETIPSIAEQLPGLEEQELWEALDTLEPDPAYRRPDAGTANLPSGVAGLSSSRTRWEGLLFPSTYSVGSDESGAGVVTRMHDELLRVTNELGYDQAIDRVGLTPYEVVIVASLVEAEAKNDADRAKIARVIYNRLAVADLPIGVDASYIYAAQDRNIEVTRELLEQRGPYGLRTVTGLPPSPISSPGRASLEAAINPADGDWIFYVVADEVGSFVFATELDEVQVLREQARDKGLFD